MSLLSSLKFILTIDCRNAMQLISEDMDHNLSRSNACAVRLHLLICRACRRARRQLHFLRQAVRHQSETDAADTSPPAGLSEATRDNIKGAIADRTERPDG